MDPNEALRIIRENVATYHETDDAETANDAAARVVEHVDALDGWLSKGGFLPSEWDRTTQRVVFDTRLITEAHGLRSEHGENPEYDRGLVELVIRMTPGASHDEHTEMVRGLVGIVDDESEGPRPLVCRDCARPLHQRPEKALSGEVQMVWADDTDSWVCTSTADEHRPGVRA